MINRQYDNEMKKFPTQTLESANDFNFNIHVYIASHFVFVQTSERIDCKH